MQRSNPSKKRRRQFQSGNPGRPCVAQESVEVLLDIDGCRASRPQGNHHGEGQRYDGLAALQRSPAALRARAQIRDLQSASAGGSVGAAIVEAGKLISSEAAERGKLDESYARAPQMSDLARRVGWLEEAR